MHFWGGNTASNEDLMAKYLTTNPLQPVRSMGGSSGLHIEPHSPSEKAALGRVVRRAEKDTSAATLPGLGGSESNGSGPVGPGSVQSQGRDFIQTYNPFAV